MIQFSCECGQKLKVDDKYAGKKIRCPKCKAVAMVPSEEEDFAQAVSASAATQRMRSPDSEEYDFKTLPKLKALDDLVDLEDDDESEEGDSGDPVAAPPTSSKVYFILSILFALIGLSGAIGSGIYLIPPAYKGIKAADAGPVEYELYSSDEGASISFKYPKGWKLETGGGTGGAQGWARVSSGSTVVEFRTSTAGAAIGGYGVNALPPDASKELEPVHGVHKFFKEQIQAEDSSYEEQNPEFVMTGFGSSRLSQFTSGSPYFGMRYGYRLTALGTQHQWNAKASCSSQSKFDQSRDVLRTILLSLGNAKPQN